MNKKTVEYVQRTVDDALTRLFYDAKSNDFDKRYYSSVYLCTYKNKLVILLSKAEFRSNFQSCIELHCPGLTDKSMKFHLENILKKIPRVAKEQISYVTLALSIRYSEFRIEMPRLLRQFLSRVS